MSRTRLVKQTEETAALAGETTEHTTNPLVASYDLIDFTTTIAFVTANIAATVNPIFPLVSNLLHILNYALLGYIQAKGLHTLGQQQMVDDLQKMPGAIINQDQLAAARDAFLPPKKDKKSDAEFMWDVAMYILKMMICIFLTTISVLSIAVAAGSVAAIINGAMLPIAYVITTGINVLKFGKNMLKGIYDYFFKGSNTEQGSAYQYHHKIVDRIEDKLESERFDDVVTDAELTEYVDSRNAINQAGRENIQNGIVLGLNAAFLAASILLVLSSSMLVSAVIPPLGATIASALFVGAGIIFAIHGISVLANVIRKSKGKEEKATFFDWITNKIYPTVTKDEMRATHQGKIAPATAVISNTVDANNAVHQQEKPAIQPEKVIKKIKPFSLSPSWNGFSGGFYGATAPRKPANTAFATTSDQQRVMNM